MDFEFYLDSIKFVGIMFLVATIGMVFCAYLYVMRDVSIPYTLIPRKRPWVGQWRAGRFQVAVIHDAFASYDGPGKWRTIWRLFVTGVHGVHYNKKSGHLYGGRSSCFAGRNDDWYRALDETSETTKNILHESIPH